MSQNVDIVDGLLIFGVGFSDPYCKFKLGAEKFKSKVSRQTDVDKWCLLDWMSRVHSVQVCSKTLNPQWKEQFDLHVFEDQSHVLEIEVWDRDYRSRDDFMGMYIMLVSVCLAVSSWRSLLSCSIDLDDLAPEETHRKTLQLSKCESGEITVLLTVSGTTSYCMEETDGKTASGDAKKDFAAGYVRHLLNRQTDRQTDKDVIFITQQLVEMAMS